MYRYFALFSTSGVNVYTFDCKLVSSPKWPNMQCDLVQRNHVSMSDHMLVLRDQLNDKSEYPRQHFYVYYTSIPRENNRFAMLAAV